MKLELFIIGFFFCYGMFTLQRPGFLLDFLPRLWKLFPKYLHEPLYSCGVCVSSFWGIIFLFLVWTQLYCIAYLIAFCGGCALLDRAVKFFEYGYRYSPVKPLSNYSYLENMGFRDSLIESFLVMQVEKNISIIEIGGYTPQLRPFSKYYTVDKELGDDIIGKYIMYPYFILIKGLAFEGNFDYLLNLLSAYNCKGFIIEGSLSGESKRQLQWIQDTFPEVIRLPYMTGIDCEAPDHCGGDINNRIILIKPLA